jgi:hypothetical protein
VAMRIASAGRALTTAIELSKTAFHTYCDIKYIMN